MKTNDEIKQELIDSVKWSIQYHTKELRKFSVQLLILENDDN